MGVKPHTVIIADDHHLVVHSLKHIVEESLALDCVAVAHDGLSCVDHALALQPDLILLDLNLPKLRGDEVIRLLAQGCVNSRILVITAATDPVLIKKVWTSDVSGIVLKGSAFHDICEAITTVLAGRRYVTSEVSAIISLNTASEAKIASLTNRERQVFELLVQRMPIATISTSLDVSPKTIDNHKTRIMAKLEVHSQADLIAFAVRAGFRDLILKSSVD